MGAEPVGRNGGRRLTGKGKATMMAARSLFDGSQRFMPAPEAGDPPRNTTMIKKSKVIAAIHEGVFNAHKKYEKWSGGEWIGDYGVEGFLVSEIASTIHQFQEDGEYLYLELPFSDIKAWSGARKRRVRPTKGIRMARRVDIALCNENNEPVYVIEVKRKWDNTV